MMVTSTQNMLPHRLRLKSWDRTHNYELDIKQTKIVNQQEMITHCRIPITVIMVHHHEKAAVFRLKMDKPAFNGSRDYDKLQWIFAKLFTMNETIVVRANQAGAIRHIINEQQIQQKWPSVRQRISEVYDSPLVEEILKRYEQNIHHHFQSLYRQDMMIQFLFNGLFRQYPEDQTVEETKMLTKHLGDIPFPVTERKQLSDLDMILNKAIISVEGSPDTNQVDTEAVNRYLGQVTGNLPKQPYRFMYRGEYQIDTRVSCIKEAFLRVEGKLGEAYQKCTTYNLTTISHE